MKYITAEGPSSELATGFLGAVCERPTGHTYEAAHEPARFANVEQAKNYLASARAEAIAAMPAIDALLQEKNICPVVDDRENIKNLIYAETQPLREQLETARTAWEQIKPLIRDSSWNSKGPLGTTLDKALAQIGAGQKGGK